MPGRPEPFTQGIGLAFGVLGALAWVVGVPTATVVSVGLLAAAAPLEPMSAVCLGCVAYRFLWECGGCTDINVRLWSSPASSVPARS